MCQSHKKVCGKHISHSHHAYESPIRPSLISARNIIMEDPNEFYGLHNLIFLLLTLLVTSISVFRYYSGIVLAVGIQRTIICGPGANR